MVVKKPTFVSTNGFSGRVHAIPISLITYITHFQRGSCRNGYYKKEYAEERIRDFLADEP